MDKHELRRQKALKAFLEERGFDVEHEISWDRASAYRGHLHKFTGQGDYVGGSVERSNREAMLETFPKLLCTTSSGYGYEACTLTDPMEFMEAWHWPNHPLHASARELGEALDALSDYPLFDEEHHSALEMELISEALPEAVEDVWKNATGSWDVDLIPFPDELKEKIEAALEDRDGGSHCPEIETGCIVYFVDAARKKATEIAKEYFVKWESEIREAVLEDEEVRDDLVEAEVAERFSLPALPTEAQEVIDQIQEAIRKGWNPVLTLEEIGRIISHPGVPS